MTTTITEADRALAQIATLYGIDLASTLIDLSTAITALEGYTGAEAVGRYAAAAREHFDSAVVALVVRVRERL